MSQPSDEEFVLSRTVNAPRAVVWRAWTEADRLAKWWGPKGFTMLKATLDLRPGGLFHYGMQAPNGLEMWGRFVFREVSPQDKLAFVVSFSDPAGGMTRHFAHEKWPLEMLNEVTFTEADGRTTLTLRGRPINATEEERAVYKAHHDSMRQGFGGTFEQLEAYLATAG